MKRAWIAVGVMLGLGLLLARLADVLAPVFTALFLAYLLDPLVTRFERHVGRHVGALIAVLLLLLSCIGAALLVLPLLIHELGLLAERLPDYVTRAKDAVVPYLQQVGVDVPDTMDAAIEYFSQAMQAFMQSALGPIGKLLHGVLGTLRALGSAVAFVLLVPFLSFFFLRGFPRIRGFLFDLVPLDWRDGVVIVAQEIGLAVSTWLRGQLGVMAAQAVLYAIGLSLCGLDYGVLIGLIAGLLAFIPYAGVSVGLTLALLVSLIDFHGWMPLFGVVLVFAAVQTLDALLITPHLVGKSTGLGPAGVLVALLVCGELFGFVGLLLAVPIAAAAVVVGRHLLVGLSAAQWFEEKVHD